MFNLKINGFRCNKETDGAGSDEIGLFIAALPVRKNSVRPYIWTYAEGYRDYRIRWASDMDTNEAFIFQYPMSVNRRSSDYDALEIIMLMFEIDGGNSTKSQALEEHWDMRKKIEADFQVGIALGSFPDSTFGGYGSYLRVMPNMGWDSNEAFGAGEDLIGIDLWHIDLDRPLDGEISWDDYPRFNNMNPGGRSEYFQNLHSIERKLYKNRRDDGSLSETRSYRSNAEDSKYTFEVEYTDI
ncbi:hypothetical protein [Zobellia uliginosa]|uniref:hypothetical protein n=1 Tax=Zobellia uliginosa TaxID=143224 RepID=UPI0026E469FB|nr:hypothetical protein [Zobellia uliginosa]MDO6517787.1 hypothetical protein [Zobellia uliginosa]